MPTNKPRITFALSDAQLTEISNFQFQNRMKNQTQAILALIEKGLDEYEERTPDEVLSSDEMELVRCYRRMNLTGQDTMLTISSALSQHEKTMKSDDSTVSHSTDD